MSLLSRLFGRSPPAAVAPPVSEPVAATGAPPPADVAARAQDEEASLSQAIAAGDMATIGKWVLEGSSTRIRQMAARSVTDPDQLRELIPATRHGKDKNVHRILTSRRDELLAEVRRSQQLQADLDESAAAIARHSERPYDASYPTILERLETRWSTLASQAKPDLQSEVAQYLQRAHEVVAHHRQALEAEAERQRSAAVAAAAAQRQRELEAQAAVAAVAEQTQVRDAERLAMREAEQAQRAADEARTHDILGLLRQARASLDHGGTARAARLRAAITEKLAEAPALPAWFARQLEQVDSRLAELQDWKTFRVVPKRAELVQQMQSLVGADLSPEELAQQIRRLRDEWRTLNRGAGEDPSDERQQFQEAAERAYEPCREHFARQAELRKENQERREALIERLTVICCGACRGAPELARDQPGHRRVAARVASVCARGPGDREAAAGTFSCAGRRVAGASRCRV